VFIQSNIRQNEAHGFWYERGRLGWVDLFGGAMMAKEFETCFTSACFKTIRSYLEIIQRLYFEIYLKHFIITKLTMSLFC
jgi:hypothetical protein